MNRIIYSILLPITILALAACNLNNPSGPPAVAAFPAVTLITQVQNASDTFNSAGQIINYSYTVTNTGTMPLAGPVAVAGNKALGTCPDLTTIGNLDATFDPNEIIVCSGSYTITQADLTAGSVTNIATAIVAGTSSIQADAVVVLGENLGENKALTLTRSAEPATYNEAGQTLKFTYGIQNTGTTPLGPAQFIVNDDDILTPINCDSGTKTLAPNETVNCTATYTVSQADIDAGSVTSTVTASGGGATVAQPMSTTLTKSTEAQNPSFVPGSTIQHTVVKGEWLIQIARCYGADTLPRAGQTRGFSFPI